MAGCELRNYNYEMGFKQYLGCRKEWNRIMMENASDHCNRLECELLASHEVW
jgi:hypothetical protein